MSNETAILEAQALGVHRSTIYRRRSKARQEGKEALAWDRSVNPSEAAGDPSLPVAGGILPAPDATRKQLTGRRFVFTCAQNNTLLHEDFWKALQTYCQVNDAQLGVSRITYNKSAWRAASLEKSDAEEVWYDPRIAPYVIDESASVAKGLVFCGELDILPTAKSPFASLDDYTGPKSGIIPHTKMQMKSYATMKYEDAKFLYTTGACTLRNYIERKAGQIATFHHVFGAVVVEVEPDGSWFVRQLNASDDGTFFDLDQAYGPGWHLPASDFGRPIVNLGDVHIEKMDPEALMGALDMLNVLQPESVFIHDLIDFENRNHHNIKDPYFLAEQHNKRGSVEQDLTSGVTFLANLNKGAGMDANLFVIRSNHDQAFKRWLQEANGHMDPVNARFWHECNAQMFHKIEQNDPGFDIFTWSMDKVAIKSGQRMPFTKFVQEDESIVKRDIEFGMHGHRGPNGARGNPIAFRQLGRRANTGHTHSAGIIDGIYTAGVLADLDMGYNAGPSSWSHSHILTHPTGKRQIITQRGSRWKARYE